ncbi:MAG: type II toxin-antitoxin system RelE/ParE family toxin [Pirellulales bacterium]|nr:type II toxin-antitoxin system RelE/ParE family toxin [Pirellulales bacterium]
MDEIWHYIACDNITAADRLIDSIAERCRLFSANSEMGQKRPDLDVAIRCFSVGNYVIYFRPITDGIEVVRVLHGARDSKNIFSKP